MAVSKPVRVLEDMGDGTHRVPLTRGKYALIDSADAAYVGQWNWCAWVGRDRKWYAVRTEHHGARSRTVRMHRVLLGDPPVEMDVDHRNGDSLNNRRSNIRLATRAQNAMNQRRSRVNTSGYKGVSWYARHGQWGVRIVVGGRTHFLGLYRDPAEAHAAYCEAAVRLHGEFANAG